MPRPDRRTLRFWLAVSLIASLSGVGGARADEEEEFSLDEPDEEPSAQAKPSHSPPPTASSPPPPPTVQLEDEQALAEEEASDERFRSSTDPYEDPKRSYFFVGAAWRYVIMPAFVLEWFMEAAPTIATSGSFFGEFGYRKNNFQVTAEVGWMKWNFKGPFQLSGDPPEDTEWLRAKFNLLMATATVTWSTAFTDWMAVEYGIEGGLAVLTGNLTRSEAYKKNGGGWAECPTYNESSAWPESVPQTAQTARFCDTPVGNPTPATNQADEEGAHYHVKVPHGIANKGLPRVVPVLGPRVSLRFKPIHQLVIRVDVPLPLFPYGFVGGLAAHYGF